MHQLPLEPDDVDQQPLGEPVLAHHAHGEPVALVGELEVPVALDGQQPVALHPGDRLADRRPALVQPLGDPRAQRHDALLVQLVDGPEVHLGRVDQVAHRGHSPPWAAEARRSGLAQWRTCRDRRDVVPPRPPARRQPGPARRLRRAAATSCRCSSSTPRCGTGGRVAPGVPGRLAARPRRRAPAAPGRARRACAATRCARWCLRRPGGRRDAGARRRRLRPVRPPARPRRGARAGRRRRRAGAHRVAVRRRPGPGDERLPATPYQVFTPFCRAWPEHGWRDPVDAPTGASWLSLGPTVRRPLPRRCPDGLELPTAGEAAARTTLAGVRRRRARRLRRRPRPARPRRDQPDVGAPEVGRDPPAHDARRPAGRTGAASAAALPAGAGVPGVLRRRARSPTRSPRATTYRPELAAMAYDEPGDQFTAWREGRTGFPIVDAGMRQLRATGLDAQPGADDRRQLPGQGPPRRVAARRPPLHAVARRRRPRVQPARLAVGRRLRHRRGAVLPGVQPDDAGREVRPRRRLRPTVGAGAGRRADASTSTSRPPRPTGSPTATPSRSWTTRRSAWRRWSATRGSSSDPPRPGGPRPLQRARALRQRRVRRRLARRLGCRTRPAGPSR